MSIGSSCGCGVTVVTVESLLMSADSLLGPSTSIVSPGEESTVSLFFTSSKLGSDSRQGVTRIHEEATDDENSKP